MTLGLFRKVYNYYSQCLYDRILGNSSKLNTASIILLLNRSLDSKKSPQVCFWIWAISGVWEAQSKNKYCLFWRGILPIYQVPVQLGDRDIKKEMQHSIDNLDLTRFWCQRRLLIGKRVPSKLENFLIILSVTQDIQYFDANIKTRVQSYSKKEERG